MEKELIVASNSQPTRQELAKDTFEREIGPSIIAVRTIEPVAKDDALDKLKELAEEVAIDAKHLSITGPPLGRSFTILMDGDGMLAARRVKKIIESIEKRLEKTEFQHPSGV